MKGFFVSLGALFEKHGAAQTGILTNTDILYIFKKGKEQINDVYVYRYKLLSYSKTCKVTMSWFSRLG